MKSKLTAYLWWSFSLVGVAGLHRCYLGKWWTGTLWFLTFGLLGLGTIYDFLTLYSSTREVNIRKFYQKYPIYFGAPTYVYNHTVNYHRAPALLPRVAVRVQCSYCGAGSPEGVRSCFHCGAAF